MALNSHTSQIVVQIPQRVGLTLLLGTVFRVGYGPDTNEMIAGGRCPDVFTVTKSTDAVRNSVCIGLFLF